MVKALYLICLFCGLSNLVWSQTSADFTANPTSGCNVPHTVFFTDQSTLPDTWFWDFGDGNTSTAQNPIHTYTGFGTFTVILTVTDTITGQVDTHSGTILVGDTTAPTVICPGNQSATLDANCEYTLLDYTTMAGASDNCDPSVTLTQSPIAGTVVTSTTAITITATDDDGNAATCTFNVVVSDNTPPTLSCPPDQAENYDINCQFTVPDYSSLATVSDNCTASPTITQSPSAGTIITSGTTVTLFATDAAGNSSNCSFNITLTDNLAPIISCPSAQAVPFDANCEYQMADFSSMMTITEACGTPTITQSPIVGTTVTSSTLVTMTVDDGNGNSSQCTFSIVPQDLTPPVVSCSGTDTVYVDANCTGIVPNYSTEVTITDNCDANPTYSQSPTAGSPLSGIGTQDVTIYSSDANGNIDSCIIVVSILDTISPTITCEGDITTCDPVVTFNIPNGSDNCGTAVVTQTAGLTSGSTFPVGTTTNEFTVTDLSGNTATCSFDVIVETYPQVSSVITEPTCNGDADGAIDITVTGGTPNYNYNWDNGATSEDISSIGAGTYTIVVTDDNGCTDSVEIVLTEPDAVSASGTVNDVSCFGANDGSIDITATGGDGSYTYLWSNGSSDEDLSGLAGSSYSVSITDGNGCSGSASFNVSEPDSMTIDTTLSIYSHGHNISVTGESDGSVDVTISGGTAPYTYTWSNGSTSDDLENVPAGTYVLTVTDANGCEQTITVVLTEPLPVNPADAFTPNGDGYNDFFIIENIDEYPENELLVMNRWGTLVYSASPYNNDWDGSPNKGLVIYGNQIPEGAYFYVLKLEKGVKPIKGSIVVKR